MTNNQIQTAARQAVDAAKAKYGSGWEHTSLDARRGAVASAVLSNFAAWMPAATFQSVQAVMSAAWALFDSPPKKMTQPRPVVDNGVLCSCGSGRTAYGGRGCFMCDK